MCLLVKIRKQVIDVFGPEILLMFMLYEFFDIGLYKSYHMAVIFLHTLKQLILLEFARRDTDQFPLPPAPGCRKLSFLPCILAFLQIIPISKLKSELFALL